MFEMYGYGSEDLERDTSGDYMVDAASACLPAMPETSALRWSSFRRAERGRWGWDSNNWTPARVPPERPKKSWLDELTAARAR